MKNLREKFNLDNLVIFLIVLLPFLDIYKSIIGNKIEILGISLVEIFNFIYTAVLVLILILKAKKENRKIYSLKNLILVIGIFAIYIVGHIINILKFKSDLIMTSNINYIIEIYHIIKSYILPIILLFVFSKIHISKDKILKTLSFLALLISLIIVITNIFKVSLLAYGSDYEDNKTIEGSIFDWGKAINNCEDINLYTSRGLFYSGNQMSAILASLTFISAFVTLKENKIHYYIFLLIKYIALLMISTKTALFAIFLSIAYVFVYVLFEKIVYNRKTFTIKAIICFSIIIVSMILLYKISPVHYKILNYMDISSDNRDAKVIALEDMKDKNIKEIESVENPDELNDEQTLKYLKKSSSSFGIPYEYIELYSVDNNSEFWIELIKNNGSEVSNFRHVKLLIYRDIIKKNNNSFDKIFGIGYTSNFPELERDVLNQNILYGYIGTLIFVMPFFILTLICGVRIIKHLKDNWCIENYALVGAIIYMLIVSMYTGHIFGIFIPSAILAIMLGTLLYSTDKSVLSEPKLKEYEVKPEINKKKISFLLLHLGYGGIETATINTANALSKRYEVELISFYNLKENQSKFINKNVSVKYLYNGGPNRVEFMEALKQKNIIKVIKEGFKAVNILVKRKALIKKEILNSDAFALVSTRYNFTPLLSKYGRKDAIKIAQEHHHHNNEKKYINILKNKYKNIDYLFALTEGLKEDYIEFLKNNKHTKILVVPNMLITNNNICSDLKQKNVISICRLHKDKKIDELINIFSKLKDKETKLYIIGDGEEKENLEKQIKELKLKDRVIMTGYLDKEGQLQYLKDSSVYAMTSISEGLPMVMLEAMSFGIPCIAYKTQSGVCDIINKNNGFVIENRNEAEYLEKLESLLSDYELRHKMSAECINKANEYNEDKVIKYWIDVLEDKIK